MARVKLSHPDQPLGIRLALQFYEFLASLKLAVVLIFTIAMVLIFATFLEANFGAKAVHWYIYQSWWFIVIHVLLATNIFCAASIRYPWKRHQTGFVVTHVGLLVLLAGSAISYRSSLNSQMLVFRGESSQRAIDTDETRVVLANLPGHPEQLTYAFESGPFNWGDQPFTRVALANFNKWAPTRGLLKLFNIDPRETNRPHAPETVYQNDQVKVEIVNFYARAEDRSLPYVKLNFYNPLVGADMNLDLEYVTYSSQGNSIGFGDESFGQLGRVTLQRTDDPAEVAGFLGCVPPRSIDQGTDGAIVVWHEDEAFSVLVADLQKRQDAGEAFELPTGVKLKLVSYNADHRLPYSAAVMKRFPWLLTGAFQLVSLGPMAAVEYQLPGDETFTPLECYADYPWLAKNIRNGLRMEFYHPSVKGRIDIIEGPDNQLHHRTWQQKQGRVVASGPLEVSRDEREGYLRGWQPVNTWSTGGQLATGEQGFWQMTVEKYIPEQEGTSPFSRPFERNFGPGQRAELTVNRAQLPIPLPFFKDDQGVSKRVQLRVSRRNDAGEWEEQKTCWLRLNLPEPWELQQQQQVVWIDQPDQKEKVGVRYQVKEDQVGFAVKLVEFDLEVDAGTSTASNYTSKVVQVDVRNEDSIRNLRAKLDDANTPEDREAIRRELKAEEDRLNAEYLKEISGKKWPELTELAAKRDYLEAHIVTMNEPLDYPDLQGRTLRFFQENYLPPDKASGKDLGSIFRVNYDPGRPVKYLGSLLICLGVFIMFYMRAYFFKPPRRAPVTLATAPIPSPPLETVPVGADDDAPSPRKKQKQKSPSRR